MNQSDIEESSRQLREEWKLYAQASPGGESFDRDGLSFANAKQPWVFMNLCVLNRPATNQSDLESRAKEAVAYFGVSKNPWLLGASEDWLGGKAHQVLSRLDLEFKINLSGMLAEPLTPRFARFHRRSFGASTMKRPGLRWRISTLTPMGFRTSGEGGHWAPLFRGRRFPAGSPMSAINQPRERSRSPSITLYTSLG